ncbi:TraB/VirB10 family protein [Burkholderia cenocepacia]|uniref:TraB/VirB10 family protein n=1 Tax=Burkholderia cenocepacia TaxID=95486 RepID=UPI0022329EEA|nr:TraB/VirB10 family protein [Burkholderia cenocepacia]MCW3640599.1 TraB/VirB10 family protein [Burkholderia cenocepacia]
MSDPNAQVKKRQLMLIGGTVTVILLLGAGGMFFFDNGPTVRAEKPKTVAITAPGSVDDKDAWRAQEAAKAQANADKLNELTQALKKQQDEQQKLKDELEKARKEGTSAPGGNKSADAATLNQKLPSGSVLPPPTAKTGMNAATPLNSPLGQPLAEAPKRELELIQFNNPGTGGKDGSTGGTKTELIGFPVSESAKKYGQSGKENVKNSIEFIPAGSFVRVAMLNGADAPTGGQAQSNPLPIALHVLDTANLANKYKLDIRDCRFVAAAWGDLSSERMMGRTDTLTCIIDGETVEMQVKGQIIGEDGKAGVRGRLVTKQGQVLANALLAGIASGIGKAFQQSATTTSTSALGATSTIQPGDVGRAAIGSGVGNAGTALEQYYLKAADKLFPVIETDGGRTVEVLITKGAVYNGRAANIGNNYRGLLKRNGSNSRGYDDED